MNKKTIIAFSIATALAVTGCERASQPTSTVPAEATVAAVKSGIELMNLDTQVKPQQDFFRYVNGNWLAKTEIPSDKASWGSFNELREEADKHVLTLIKEAASKPAEAGSDAQKIGDLYRAYLDTAKIDSLGLIPLKQQLADIDNLKSAADLASFWGNLQAERYGTPVSLYVSQDQKNSDQYVVGASQSGLGLPDRDYYLKTDEKSEQIKKQYQWMIAKFWELAGWENGSAAAATVFEVESKLAEAQWSRVQNRDRNATYNKMTLSELAAMAPGFDWQAFTSAAKVGAVSDVVVRQPTYFTAFAAISQQVSLEQWQTYLKFHLLRNYARVLSSDFDQTSFDFYGRVLSGIQEQKPREDRAVEAINSALGFMVGKMYVEKYFKPQAKERMDQLIKNLRVAFEQAINDLEWMSAETKVAAQEKL
ncbi:MAG: M13 family metallopeptidase, partial [Gammaproteobacteria bacterium]|nr:M13 family metallopeptidase [Gammaproteobacteria bacterium]